MHNTPVKTMTKGMTRHDSGGPHICSMVRSGQVRSGPVVYTFEIVLVVASIQYPVLSNRDCDSNLDSCALFLFFSSVHPSILLWSVTVTVRCIVNHLLLSLAGRVIVFVFSSISPLLSFNSCHDHDICVLFIACSSAPSSFSSISPLLYCHSIPAIITIFCGLSIWSERNTLN